MSTRRHVLELNKSLIENELVIFTWGNASARTDQNQMLIKPSGVPFKSLNEGLISQMDINTGKLIHGPKPSVDSPTHLEIYRSFDGVNSVIHTHSKYCTIFAQAKVSIPCLGTTHSDYFYGNIPVIEDFSFEEVQDYEKSAGKKIVAHFKNNGISYKQMKAALLPSHGVFVWGENTADALENAIVLENVAEMAYKTLILTSGDVDFDLALLDKHYYRKHGDNKYYGQ